jgi:hypothetical protein
MTEHNINGGKVNVTGDASIVFKTDGKEVFRLETQLNITENKELTHEEMLEIAAEREALNALDNLYQNNDNGLKELAKIEMEEYTDEQIKQWIEND